MRHPDMLYEMDKKEIGKWACAYRSCLETATHEWELDDGEFVATCPNHSDREFVLSIIRKTDNCPTFADLLIQGFQGAAQKQKEDNGG